MSDLDGEDAFRHVVEQLIEQVSKNGEEVGKRKDAEDKVREMRPQLEEARRLQARAQQAVTDHNTKGMLKLSELHVAATVALGVLPGSDIRERLRIALDAAGPYCDEIPF